MGNCTSASDIMEIGQAILNEFFSKGLIGQAITALSSPSKCRPTNNLPDFMGCHFMRGQKDAWEIILVLFVLMMLAIAALSYILYRKTTRAIGSIIETSANRSDLNLVNQISGSVDAKAITYEDNKSNPRVEVSSNFEHEMPQSRRAIGPLKKDEESKHVHFNSDF